MKSKSIGSLILLALLAPSCGSGGKGSKTPPPPRLERWGNRFRSPTSVNLRAVRFNDASRGIVAGERNTILFTQDGGITWEALETTPPNRIGDITAISALGPALVGVGKDAAGGGRNWFSDNTVSYTTDDVPGLNGTTEFTDVVLLVGSNPRTSLHLRSDGFLDLYQPNFQSISFDTTYNIPVPPSTVTPPPSPWLRANAMFVGPGGTTGWIVGSKAVSTGQIRYTLTDVTGAWNDATFPDGTPPVLNAIWMLGPLNGFCCGDSGTVLQTTDGKAWKKLVGDPTNGLTTTTFRAIRFFSLTSGVVVGDDGTNGCIYTLTLSSGTWNLGPKLQFPDKLYGLNHATSLVGYAVGDNGIVVKTTDGWATNPPSNVLRTPNPVVTPQFNAVAFDSGATNGLVGGNGGAVYRSLDSGRTWTSMNGTLGALNVTGVAVPKGGSGSRAYLCGTDSVFANTTLTSAIPSGWLAGTGVPAAPYQAIHFPKGDLNGICVGAGSVIYTTDGSAWQGAATAPTGTYRALASDPAGTTTYAAGDGGAVAFTLDDVVNTPSTQDIGKDWTTMTPIPASGNLLCIQAPTGTFNKLFVGSDNGNVYRLPAGSSTWQSATVQGGAPVVSLAFSDDLNGVATVAGGSPGVYITIDGGQTWQKTYPHVQPSTVLRAAWMNPSRIGFLAGDNGIVLRTESAGQ